MLSQAARETSTLFRQLMSSREQGSSDRNARRQMARTSYESGIDPLRTTALDGQLLTSERDEDTHNRLAKSRTTTDSYDASDGEFDR
jgi:hypothetical protein